MVAKQPAPILECVVVRLTSQRATLIGSLDVGLGFDDEF